MFFLQITWQVLCVSKQVGTGSSTGNPCLGGYWTTFLRKFLLLASMIDKTCNLACLDAPFRPSNERVRLLCSGAKSRGVQFHATRRGKMLQTHFLYGNPDLPSGRKRDLMEGLPCVCHMGRSFSGVHFWACFKGKPRHFGGFPDLETRETHIIDSSYIQHD